MGRIHSVPSLPTFSPMKGKTTSNACRYIVNGIGLSSVSHNGNDHLAFIQAQPTDTDCSRAKCAPTHSPTQISHLLKWLWGYENVLYWWEKYPLLLHVTRHCSGVNWCSHCGQRKTLLELYDRLKFINSPRVNLSSLCRVPAASSSALSESIPLIGNTRKPLEKCTSYGIDSQNGQCGMRRSRVSCGRMCLLSAFMHLAIVQ